MGPDGRVSGIGADVEAEVLGVRTAEVDAVAFVNFWVLLTLRALYGTYRA